MLHVLLVLGNALIETGSCFESGTLAVPGQPRQAQRGENRRDRNGKATSYRQACWPGETLLRHAARSGYHVHKGRLSSSETDGVLRHHRASTLLLRGPWAVGRAPIIAQLPPWRDSELPSRAPMYGVSRGSAWSERSPLRAPRRCRFRAHRRSWRVQGCTRHGEPNHAKTGRAGAWADGGCCWWPAKMVTWRAHWRWGQKQWHQHCASTEDAWGRRLAETPATKRPSASSSGAASNDGRSSIASAFTVASSVET